MTRQSGIDWTFTRLCDRTSLLGEITDLAVLNQIFGLGGSVDDFFVLVPAEPQVFPGYVLVSTFTEMSA